MSFWKTLKIYSITFLSWAILEAMIHSQNAGLTKALVGAANGAGFTADWNWTALTALISGSLVTFFVLACYRTLTRGSLEGKIDLLLSELETTRIALDQNRLQTEVEFEQPLVDLE